MNEPTTIHRGFNAGHVLLALFGGAVAGAGIAYLTAPDSGAHTRDRLRTIAHDTNASAQRVPTAVRKATEAARDAFIEALEIEDDEPKLTVRGPKPKRGTARQNHVSA